MQAAETTTNLAPVILLGNANVGKSVLFAALSGRYVTVSNYPGTTIEVARATMEIGGSGRPLIDTPGIQSLTSQSDDERVTRDIVLSTPDATVLLVIDAKNLLRGLILALELAETGVPFLVVLNMFDEVEDRGIKINTGLLALRLGVPVIATVANRGTGILALRAALPDARPAQVHIPYDESVEKAVEALAERVITRDGVRPRAVALMALGRSADAPDDLKLHFSPHAGDGAPPDDLESSILPSIRSSRLNAAREINDIVISNRVSGSTPAERLGRWMVHPLVGWPLLMTVLWLMYQFVGVFGAGTLVDALETNLFGNLLNPWLIGLSEAWIPFAFVRDFLVGEYGVITMGVTYAIAIVLPIVATYFLAFSFLEDSGYLPRLAVMLDRFFRWMGLNGKAVLPMILGLGCDTMATMTTRILDTRKERIQVTLLLALGVPCSAQLGVILGMIAGLGAVAVGVWTGVVVGTIFVVGYIAAKVIPGDASDFILELPPLRLPSARNIILKTTARVEWYLKEVLPVFVVGTAALFALDRLNWLSKIETAMSPLIVGWLGLPVDVSEAFLIGFLRRDYGAAGLFAVARDGGLDPIQITVSLVVITLFMPCFANFLMIIKEHGIKVALAVTAFIFPLAFLIGGLLYRFLTLFPIIG